MEVQVNITSNADTNFFLRNLWAILGNDKHRAWQLTPRKDSANRRIYFGFFSCNLLNNVYMVSAKYERKGTIKSIIFKMPDGKDVLKEDESIITNSINFALNYKDNIKEKWYSYTVKSVGIGINKYSDEMFEIESFKREGDLPQEIRITTCAKGFDETDFQTDFKKKRVQSTDFLSTVVESALFPCSKSTKETEIHELNEYNDHNWMEELPIKHSKILMQTKAKDFFNSYLKGNVNEQMRTYLSACRLYHTALKYYSFIYFYDRLPLVNFAQFDASPDEIANTLFMSSLEVLSSIMEYDEQTCNECGQKVYSIRKRVIDLCEKYSDEYLPKKIVDTFYKDRSSYVHAGIMYSEMSYAGSSVPTISSSGEVVSQIPMVNLVSLKESVGYIFRAVLEDLSLEIE